MRSMTLDLMARCLADGDVSLADERACILYLLSARFTAAEVADHLHHARDLALMRRMRQFADFLDDLGVPA